MIVDRIRHNCQGDTCELTAQVRSEAWSEEQFTLWYRVPAELAPDHTPDTPDGSPFLAGLLLWCLRRSEPLRIEGTVSPRLLDNVALITDVCRSLWPGIFSVVEVTAEPRGPGAGSEAVATFFTRGVDSWYSVLSHGHRSYDGPPLTHAVYVPSVDFMYDDEHRARSTSATAAAASEAGLTPITVETNLRSHTEPFLHWGYYSGAGRASIALALGARRVLTAASRSYGRLTPYGTHPLLDPLWSTDRTELVHHGAEATRWDKVKFLANEPLALRTLKVCFDENTDGNCGRCPKCLLTMSMLEAAGALDACPFDMPFDPEQVARLNFPLEWPNMFHEVIQEIDDPRLALAVHTQNVRPLARETFTQMRAVLRARLRLIGRELRRRPR